ncbi:MAG: peptide-methionine (S)-S-oxide reductase MsrA [Gammaproteobacteria bacterium]|nr:peptide-methionine (S)-S-oxide reductase MsrA [Gammaproteobacteria bacterium]
MKLISSITIATLILVGTFSVTNYQFNTKTNSSAADKKSIAQDMQATKQLDSIVLGEGCFWGAEKRLEALPGVVDAISGYADGRGLKASYQEIIQRKHKNNPNNYAEVVKVIFNPQQISLETILKDYFEAHDPTQINRQGNDIGTQYRSTILTNSDKQNQIANQLIDQYQPLLTKAGYGQIATIVKPLDKFHPAEEYHQDYLQKNPNGYCPDHSTGVKFDGSERVAKMDNSALLKGKQILVIDSENYCPYCEKFKQDVANDYKGSIPLSYRYASQLDGLTITTETWATPTILFLENGKEVFGHRGYLSAEDFYKVFGAFKLGNSEAYKVAFQQGTDGRFCKQYEIFKNTPDGIFIDKLSGAPLFDTRDRFNSGTGWLSFTKPVDNAVTEHLDTSYGMVRTEIRSKSSGIHLGHVFDDGPNGQPRYCINATVLEFKPRNSG